MTVLRRYRNLTHSAEAEAVAMQRAAHAGVPVPAVHAASGPEIRMDLVVGLTMATKLASHPQRAESAGRTLADLHHALDKTTTPQGSLVHGDIHPGNVIVSAQGPVLIDWTNHTTGPRALDVALTWILLGCFEPDDQTLRAHLERGRTALLRGFLEAVDARAAAAALPGAAAMRHADPATTPTEHTRIARLVEDVSARMHDRHFRGF